jgi:hypothetical protein
MTKRLRNPMWTTVLLAIALTVSTGAEVHAAKRSLLKSSFTQTAPKPSSGPLAGEPDSGSQGPLPPKDGNYSTGAGTNPNMGWLAVLRNMIMSWLLLRRP